MSDEFNLSVLYKGISLEIPCRLRSSAYTYQFLCTINETEWIMEKDDEGNLRVISTDPFSNTQKKTDPILIKAVMEELDRILH